MIHFSIIMMSALRSNKWTISV